MVDTQPLILESDKADLEELLGSPSGQAADELAGKLATARVLPREQLPAGVVTMNAEVVLRDMKSDQQLQLRLGYPDDADLAAGALSVLSPVGSAILGASEGTVVDSPAPAGSRPIAIEKVLAQPPANSEA